MYKVDLGTLNEINSDLCLTNNDKKYFVPMEVNGAELEFEVDTGAVVTCVSFSTYKQFCKPGDQLTSTTMILRDYNKRPLDLAGVTMVSVQYGSQCKILPVVVVNGERSSLLGRN